MPTRMKLPCTDKSVRKKRGRPMAMACHACLTAVSLRSTAIVVVMLLDSIITYPLM